MFNKLVVLLLGATFLGSVAASGGENRKPPPTVDVSFHFFRQTGMATNQFAVWVEDGQGKFVRTIYVTDFTAKRGGWKLRPNALPVWVKSSGIAAMRQEQIDAVSGATPGSGNFGHGWDCRDSAGEPVPPGDYVIVIEGTLRQESGVIFRAPFHIGGDAVVLHPEPEFSGDHLNERAMITSVEIRYLP